MKLYRGYICASGLLLLFWASGFCQVSVPDSLRQQIINTRNDTLRLAAYIDLANYYQSSKPDTSLLLARRALLQSQAMNYTKGISWSLNQMAGALLTMGSYNKALQYYLEQLKMEEGVDSAYHLAIVNLNIANAYHKLEDYSHALTYAKNADSLIDAHKLNTLKAYSLLNIGDMLEKMNQNNAALSYAIAARDKAHEVSPELEGAALNNLANIYRKMGFDAAAMQRYREALPLLEANQDDNFLAEAYLGLAAIYQKRNRLDSAKMLAYKSLQLSTDRNFTEKQLAGTQMLASLQKQTGNNDSAYHYLSASMALQDSIFSKDQIRLGKEMELNEELRQAEMAAQKAKEEKERKAGLQWLGIGVFIPLFIVFIIYMSRRRVKVRFIKTAGIISLLLLFEYITLLLHPRVVELSGHTPVLEVLIFVIIAALLTPTHHRIENMLTKLLTRPYDARESSTAAENNLHKEGEKTIFADSESKIKKQDG